MNNVIQKHTTTLESIFKKSRPHFLLSSLLLTAGFFWIASPVMAETAGNPIGGIIVKGGKNPGGGSFRASPNPSANGMEAVMDALERDDLEENPGNSADQVINKSKSNVKNNRSVERDLTTDIATEKKGLNAVNAR